MLSRHKYMVLKAIKTICKTSEHASVKEIANNLDKPEPSIRTTVNVLYKMGLLDRPLRGAYQLSELGAETINLS